MKNNKSKAIESKRAILLHFEEKSKKRFPFSAFFVLFLWAGE